MQTFLDALPLAEERLRASCNGASCRAQGRIKALGSGAVLHRSNRCVTLHAVGSFRSRTIMPLARGVAPARRDPPETRRRCATKEEDGRVPRIAAGECCRWQFL